MGVLLAKRDGDAENGAKLPLVSLVVAGAPKTVAAMAKKENFWKCILRKKKLVIFVLLQVCFCS